MPAALKVNLSVQEEQLIELRKTTQVKQRVKDRAEVVRLNAHGWSVAQIAKYMKLSPHTVRASIQRWRKNGVEGLWEAPGRGRKPRWTQADMEFLEQRLEQEERTYTSRQLSKQLAEERQVKLSADRIRRILKKRGGGGKELDIANQALQTTDSNKQN